jgi:hypothetical protein
VRVAVGPVDGYGALLGTHEPDAVRAGIKEIANLLGNVNVAVVGRNDLYSQVRGSVRIIIFREALSPKTTPGDPGSVWSADGVWVLGEAIASLSARKAQVVPDNEVLNGALNFAGAMPMTCIAGWGHHDRSSHKFHSLAAPWIRELCEFLGRHQSGHRCHAFIIPDGQMGLALTLA